MYLSIRDSRPEQAAVRSLRRNRSTGRYECVDRFGCADTVRDGIDDQGGPEDTVARGEDPLPAGGAGQRVDTDPSIRFRVESCNTGDERGIGPITQRQHDRIYLDRVLGSGDRNRPAAT